MSFSEALLTLQDNDQWTLMGGKHYQMSQELRIIEAIKNCSAMLIFDFGDKDY